MKCANFLCDLHRTQHRRRLSGVWDCLYHHDVARCKSRKLYNRIFKPLMAIRKITDHIIFIAKINSWFADFIHERNKYYGRTK